MREISAKTNYRIGLISAYGCAFLWGIIPIYWKMLYSIDSFVIMLYRLILAFIFVFIICLFVYKPKGIIRPLKNDKKKIGVFFLAGFLISTNWSIYIWAVKVGLIIQTSIGYYIEPLFVCFMGVLIFKEKINKYKISALILALLGVGLMVISYGGLPLVALGLAISFTAYAGIKKYLQAPALLSLLYETGLMLPIAIPAIVYLEYKGIGVVANGDIYQVMLLSLAGIVTAIPLLLFAIAANRISIVTLGITEYIAPSLALILAIFVYNESFDLIKLIGFTLIWAGLALFTFGGFKEKPKIDPGEAGPLL